MIIMYISDSNINDLNEDKLNRKGFAESLAKSIASYYDNECLTIALMGEWGSGKTSIISMFDFYSKVFNNKNIIVYFNPWHFSNRNNLLSHFFNVLGNVKQKNFINRITKKNLKKLGKSLINSTSFDPVSGKISINSSFKLESNVFNDKTLIELKNDISEDFQRLDNKVIIVIDDIDRLTNVEIQQIFMLVKSLADFPNVIYLLAFDKEVVVESLSNINVHNPEKFIEKIIQIPIVVPKMNQVYFGDLIEEYLSDFYYINFPRWEINEVSLDNFDFDNYIKKEFLDIYSLLFPFFDSPRNLYRYINLLKFYFLILKHQVNINDFMLIVALQLFEEKIYNYIRDNKYLFVFDENLKNSNKINPNQLIMINNISNNKKHVKKVLSYLFPKFAYSFNNNYYDYKNRKFRIGSDIHFDKYFTLMINAFDNFFNFSDEKLISKIFLGYDELNRTKELFDYVINHIDEIPKENAHHLINSLIDIGDLLHIPLNTFLDKRIYLSRIMDDLLKKFDNNSERFKVLEKAIVNSENSLYVTIDFLSEQDFIYNKFNYKNDRKDVSEALIDENELEKLEDIMVFKIRSWDETDKLWDSLDLEYILYSWEFWDNDIEVVKRVQEFIHEGKNALRFAKGFRNVNSTVMHADSPSEIVQKFNLKSMLKYFKDSEDLRSKYVGICNESLNASENEICNSLIKQIDEEYFTFRSGQKPGAGTYFCINCNQEIMLSNNNDALPPCPNCNGVEFKKYNYNT